MAKDQFKAEAGVEYKNEQTGQTVSYTQEQLADPASGFLSKQFKSVDPTPPPVSETPAPTPPPPTTATPTPTPTPAQAPITPEQSPQQMQSQSYTISYGDNLTKLSKQFGVSIPDLMLANPQITDPNKIYAGQQLNVPQSQGFKLPDGYEKISGVQYPTGELQRANYSNIQTDPTGTFLYGKPTDPSSAINDVALQTYDLLKRGQARVDKSKRESTKEDQIQSEIENILGLTRDNSLIGDTAITSDGTVIDLQQQPQAVDLYKQLLQSPEIKALSTRAGEIQQRLDELDASELALENDIRKEVEGEAPQSYIDALVAERSKDLYPKKLSLQAELRNITGQLSSEKENAANVLQFTLQDENQRYNRLFDYLQYQTQQGQLDLSNELSVLNYLKDLPAERSITIGGKEYKGMAEDANLSVIQFTDENNNIKVVGVDKTTGQVKYSQAIGKAPAKSSGGVKELTPSQQLSNTIAQKQLDIFANVDAGVYDTLTDDQGTIVFNKEKYKQALEDWNDPNGDFKWGWGKDTRDNPDTEKIDESSTTSYDGTSYRGNPDTKPSIYDFQITPPANLK